MSFILDELIEVITGLLCAGVFSLILFVFKLLTLKHILAFVVPGTAIISVTLIILNRYKKIGFVGWKRQRQRVLLNKKCFKATNSLDIVINDNKKLFSAYAFLIERIRELISQDVKVRLLLPEPYSETTQMISAGFPLINQIEERLLRELIGVIECSTKLHQHNLKIGLYSFPIFWEGTFVDNRTAFLDFGGDERTERFTQIDLKPVRDSQGYYDAFSHYFSILWNNSRRIYNGHDIDRIIFESSKRQSNGMIIAVTGPSGAGKTTITSSLFEDRSFSFSRIHTYTTRPPRNKSEAQSQYSFVSNEAYDAMEKQSKFAISAEFCGNYYGITFSDVYDIIDNKKDLLLDTIADPRYLKSTFGSRIMIIYITGPTNEIMASRIRSRGSSGADFNQRIDNMVSQINRAKYCDYIVVNKDLEEALKIIKQIIREGKTEYAETGDVLSESVIQYTASAMIDHGALPQDEVSYEQV